MLILRSLGCSTPIMKKKYKQTSKTNKQTNKQNHTYSLSYYRFSIPHVYYPLLDTLSQITIKRQFRKLKQNKNKQKLKQTNKQKLQITKQNKNNQPFTLPDTVHSLLEVGKSVFFSG